jgi:hypothetical protein
MRATVQNASVWIRGQAAGSMNMDTELPTRQAIRPAPMVPTQVGSGLQYCMPSVGIAEAVIACGVVAARTGADLRHGGSRIAGAWHACPAARVGAGWAGANLRNSLSTAKAMACSRFASTGSFVPSARSSRLSTGVRRGPPALLFEAGRHRFWGASRTFGRRHLHQLGHCAESGRGLKLAETGPSAYRIDNAKADVQLGWLTIST